MPINVTISGDGLRRFEELAQTLGSAKATTIYSRAINDTGKVSANETGRALADQSGLPKRTGTKAMKKQKRSTPSTLSFEIATKGGLIRVKFFRPRETQSGVTAAPRNHRQIFVDTFMRAGWWPKRVDKPNWNRQVFYRAGNKFKVAKTDVIIPEEVMTENTAKTFEKSKEKLDVRVAHYLKILASGALS